MRLFAALPLTGAPHEVLVHLLDSWRQESWPVRWVRPEGLHLTVKFLGEVDPSRLEEIGGALEAATARTPRLPLVLREIGAFPHWRRPRVLWAGLEADPAIELLVHRVESGCAALGFAIEGRPFRPHVTLGRLREGAALPPDAAPRLEAAPVAGEGLADSVVLYRSVADPGGSRFHAQAIFPLGAG
jgi:2'-5' RNA ligase